MGLVLDYGFVLSYGGRDAALHAAAEAVMMANSVFEGQLGVHLAISKVIVNEDGASGPYESTGPNDAPADGLQTRTCPDYNGVNVTGHGAEVYISSIGVALGKMSQWAAEYGTGEDLWHLLTVC